MAASTIRTFGERFSCRSCGRCCERPGIAVDEAWVQRMRQHDWALPGGIDPFVPAGRGAAAGYRIRKVDGRCVFLDEQRRCRIHTERRYEDKPEVCKAFPLHLQRVAGDTRARLSFFCPAVCDGEGTPLDRQQRWLKATRRGIGDGARTAPLMVDSRLALTDRELGRIEERLLAWYSDRGYPVPERVAACADLVRCFSGRGQKKGRRAIRELLEEARQDGLGAFAEVGRRGGRPSAAKPVLHLYLGLDSGGPGKLSRLGHYFGLRFAGLGLCRLRSGTIAAKASWRRIRRVDFTLPDDADALLTRYLVSKLQGRRLLAGEATLVTGHNLLVAAFAVASSLARLRAAVNERNRCELEDVRAGVRAADLLVVEHASVAHGPVFDRMVRVLLGPPSLCSSLLQFLWL